MKLLLLALGKPILAAAGLTLGTYNAKMVEHRAEVRLMEAAELHRAAEAEAERPAIGAAIGGADPGELKVEIAPADPEVELKVEIVPAAPVLPAEPKK